jgi:uncharacterized protein
MKTLFTDIFGCDAKPIIGMAHLPALPGSALYDASQTLDAIEQHAVRDAVAIQAGGAHGVMLENFGDVPFYKNRVPAETIACITRIATAVRRAITIPLGINVLRNDGCSALAIAHATGAQFIRVNVLCGARVTDQGIIEGIAAQLLRDRNRLACKHIAIFADVDVKHSAPLDASLPIEQEVADIINRGLADAVIVSGSGTGKPTDIDQIQCVKQAAQGAPVLIGSGVTLDTIAQQLAAADGVIVGTALKGNGTINEPIDEAIVRNLISKMA